MKSSLIALLICLLVTGASWAQSPEEAAGKAAEQKGKYREALAQYTAALQKISEGSADEQRIREAILTVAKRISPRPAIPKEAERRMARGQAAAKAATDEQGFARAAEEFRQAIRVAPWLAEAYFNLGVVLDKAGKYADAVRSLNIYLLAVENQLDMKQARNLIFEIEYRQEDAQRAKAEAAQKTHEKSQRRFQSLAGTWIYRSSSGLSTTRYQISITGTNMLTIRFISDECRLAPGASSCGTLIDSLVAHVSMTGNELTGTGSVKWNDRWPRCAWRQWEAPVSGRVSDDGNTIEIALHPDVDVNTCNAGPPTGRTKLTRD